jgi:hypothetical protein
MHIKGCAADKVFLDAENDTAPFAEPVDHTAYFGHYFRADAVSGQNQERGVWHRTGLALNEL